MLNFLPYRFGSDEMNNKKELPEVSEQVMNIGTSLFNKAKAEIGFIPMALIIGALIIFK